MTDKSAIKKEQSTNTINEHVDSSITHLTASALSASLGDIRIMKLTYTGKSSAKYTPVTDPEELQQALQYISRFSNTHITPKTLEDSEQNYSYFILQQSSINMSAWNSLVDRRLGKIPQEAKIEASIQFDLVRAGIEAQQKAVKAKQQESETPTYTVAPTPTVPKIHTT